MKNISSYLLATFIVGNIVENIPNTFGANRHFQKETLRGEYFQEGDRQLGKENYMNNPLLQPQPTARQYTPTQKIYPNTFPLPQAELQQNIPQQTAIYSQNSLPPETFPREITPTQGLFQQNVFPQNIPQQTAIYSQNSLPPETFPQEATFTQDSFQQNTPSWSGPSAWNAKIQGMEECLAKVNSVCEFGRQFSAFVIGTISPQENTQFIINNYLSCQTPSTNMPVIILEVKVGTSSLFPYFFKTIQVFPSGMKGTNIIYSNGLFSMHDNEIRNILNESSHESGLEMQQWRTRWKNGQLAFFITYNNTIILLVPTEEADSRFLNFNEADWHSSRLKTAAVVGVIGAATGLTVATAKKYNARQKEQIGVQNVIKNNTVGLVSDCFWGKKPEATVGAALRDVVTQQDHRGPNILQRAASNIKSTGSNIANSVRQNYRAMTGKSPEPGLWEKAENYAGKVKSYFNNPSK